MTFSTDGTFSWCVLARSQRRARRGERISFLCLASPHPVGILSRRHLVGAKVSILFLFLQNGRHYVCMCLRAHVFAKEDSFFACAPDLTLCVACVCVRVCVCGIEGCYFLASLRQVPNCWS